MPARTVGNIVETGLSDLQGERNNRKVEQGVG